MFPFMQHSILQSLSQIKKKKKAYAKYVQVKNFKWISSSDLLYVPDFPEGLVKLTCPKAKTYDWWWLNRF